MQAGGAAAGASRRATSGSSAAVRWPGRGRGRGAWPVERVEEPHGGKATEQREPQAERGAAVRVPVAAPGPVGARGGGVRVHELGALGDQHGEGGADEQPAAERGQVAQAACGERERQRGDARHEGAEGEKEAEDQQAQKGVRHDAVDEGCCGARLREFSDGLDNVCLRQVGIAGRISVPEISNITVRPFGNEWMRLTRTMGERSEMGVNASSFGSNICQCKNAIDTLGSLLVGKTSHCSL